MTTVLTEATTATIDTATTNDSQTIDQARAGLLQML